MKISIGGKTEDAMKILSINSYPFSPEELSRNFRILAKFNHPDVTGNPNDNKKVRKIIEAYKHLKNLAILFTSENEIKATQQRFEEDEDMFGLWDICPDCKGTGKIQRTDYFYKICPYCDPNPNPFRGIFSDFLFGFSRSSGKKTLKCNACKGTGKFKQKSGRIVDCYKCKGTGIFKIVKCNFCGGSGQIPITKNTELTCEKCKGLGKIKLNPFNPAIRKGAILLRKEKK